MYTSSTSFKKQKDVLESKFLMSEKKTQFNSALVIKLTISTYNNTYVAYMIELFYD